MEPSTELALGTRTTMSALRLWLVVLSCASVSAVLITALQRTSELSPTRAEAAHAATPERAAADRRRLPHAAFATYSWFRPACSHSPRRTD